MSPDTSPLIAIGECRVAHGRLLEAIAALGEEDVLQPSLLPGWSRAHVLSHVARNGESVVRRLSAAAEGHLVEQYEGGETGRNRAIEVGARRSAADIVVEVRESAQEVDAIFAAYPDDAWGQPILSTDGRQRPAWQLPLQRWQEVEIHHVDLKLGYRAQSWSPSFVNNLLPDTIAGLPRRANPNELLGWLLGRGPAPDLAPWD